MGVSDIRDLVYDEFGERTGILRGPRMIDSNIIAKTIVIVLLQKLKQCFYFFKYDSEYFPLNI